MDKLYGTKEYFTDGPGMSKEATEFLLDLGVKVIGIDSYGFDRSFPVMLNDSKLLEIEMCYGHLISLEERVNMFI